MTTRQLYISVALPCIAAGLLMIRAGFYTQHRLRDVEETRKADIQHAEQLMAERLKYIEHKFTELDERLRRLENRR
jgi:hypothetical protein